MKLLKIAAACTVAAKRYTDEVIATQRCCHEIQVLVLKYTKLF